MCKTFFSWLENRTGAVTLYKAVANRAWPTRLADMKMWPAVIAFLCVVQCITGFVLWMHYSPGTQTAYESVFYIQHCVWGGWLLRGIHHFSAQVLVAAALFYMLRLIFFGMYRAPREVVFWLALLIVMFGLGACLTGDLLPWDQNSYGATQVRVKYLTQIPVIGNYLYELAIGGSAINSQTLTRFTAMHIGIFAAGLIVLLILHGICDARAERDSVAQMKGAGCELKKKEGGCACGCRSTGIMHWWACQAAVNSLACFMAMALVLFMVFHSCSGLKYIPQAFSDDAAMAPSLVYGREIGPPADVSPTTSFGTARPEWTFRGLYQYALIFAGTPEFVLIFIIPSIILGIFFIMPFIGRGKFGHIFNVMFTAVGLVIMILLTSMSYKNDAKDESFQASAVEARLDSDRVYELMRDRGGMDPNGALSMLKNDWMTQGTKMFRQHCSSCHPFGNKEDGITGRRAAILAQEPSAPNLRGYMTREWIAGWLNLKTIQEDRYLGKTNLMKSKMIGYLKSDLPEYLNDEELGDKGLQIIINTLSAESGLKQPRKMNGDIPEGIAEDAFFMFQDFGCTGCHHFYTSDGTGVGPKLEGYGSLAWTSRTISEPSKVYATNDRMLDYHTGSNSDLMTQKEVEMISEWLHAERDTLPSDTVVVTLGAEGTETAEPVQETSPSESPKEGA